MPSKRVVIRLVAWLLTSAAAYAVLLCHPDPVFAHSVREGTVVLHSSRALPPRARLIARDAETRIARSPLYDPTAIHDVYLCSTKAEFALFALHRWRAGGVAYGGLTRNVFLRPSDIERDRLLRFGGDEVPGVRTLSYFIAHEIAHGMLSLRLGRWRYLHLSTWQNEGYADYVAKAGQFDFAAERRRYLEGAAELDPARSGLYLRYHLMVSYWLDQRGLSVEQLLALPADVVTPLAQRRGPIH